MFSFRDSKSASDDKDNNDDDEKDTKVSSSKEGSSSSSPTHEFNNQSEGGASLIAESKDDQSSISFDNLNSDGRGGEELVRRVCEYYFDDELLQNYLEKWAIENSKDFSPFDTEYTLNQMTLFEEFRTILEDKLERS